MEITPYYNDNKAKVAVLVTRDYGAGWSSWNEPEIAYDSRIIDFYMKHLNADPKWKTKASRMGTPQYNEFDHFLQSLGYKHIYLGGVRNLDLIWINRGQPWHIREYDGLESIEFDTDIKWCLT